MSKKLTFKQKAFVKEYLRTGHGTKSALKAYDTDDYNTADSIAVENLQKPTIIKKLNEQAKEALDDQIRIRQELQKSKKDYAVRSSLNRDILDRTGYRGKDEPTEAAVTINIVNFNADYSDTV